jgi:hypothetical protein
MLWIESVGLLFLWLFYLFIYLIYYKISLCCPSWPQIPRLKQPSFLSLQSGWKCAAGMLFPESWTWPQRQATDKESRVLRKRKKGLLFIRWGGQRESTTQSSVVSLRRGTVCFLKGSSGAQLEYVMKCMSQYRCWQWFSLCLKSHLRSCMSWLMGLLVCGQR